MKTELRNHFFPVTMSLLLLASLGLWVTYEFLNTYYNRLNEPGKTAKVIYSVCSGIVNGSVSAGKMDVERLKKIFRTTLSHKYIEHIELRYGQEIVLRINDIPNGVDCSTLSGSRITGNCLVYWNIIKIEDSPCYISENIPKAKTLKVIFSISTKGYSDNLHSAVKLLLIVFFFGSAAIAILALAWSFLNQNRTLQLKLKAAKEKKDQIEELSLAATGLAHETKNPLGVIRGLAQQISDDEGNSKKAREMSMEIMEEADITTARLGDFLSYARLRTPELKVVVAKEHSGRILALVKDDFKQAGVQLIEKVDDISIMADPEMLSQIVLNLLMNSNKFCEDGDKVTLTIKKSGHDKAILVVADTGKGIPEDFIDQVFKPYISKRSDGYGIGLAIVKRIVEQSDWDIAVESQVGKGTSIIISNINLVGV